jgi:ATP-binding protein involved in chromosome partitioning
VALSLAQTTPISGAIVVTTPSDVSLEDARKAVNMFHQVRVPLLGLVENMSYLIAPRSGERIDVFGQGGGKRTAESMGITFLGELALDPEVRIGGDSGQPVTVRATDNPHAQPFVELAERVEKQCHSAKTAGPSMTIEE